MNIFIGIDPGKTGGIASIKEGHAATVRMPELDSVIRDTLAGLVKDPETFVVIEKQQGRPNMRGVNRLMEHFGFLRGLVSAWRVRHIIVAPKDWQRETLRGMPETDRAGRKKQAIEIADRLFATGKITDGEADALLLAEYGRRLER
ncbi:MAG: hypothetical protein Q8Q12_00665 [bacterium]|nr:hypothetical protein [bacterium]